MVYASFMYARPQILNEWPGGPVSSNSGSVGLRLCTSTKLPAKADADGDRKGTTL